MKIGFVILSHNETPHLYKLLNFLKRHDCPFVIHHDFTQSRFDFSLLRCPDKELVLPCRKTRWSDTGDANFLGFKKLLDVAPDVDWVFNLSANCYPVRAFSQIIARLHCIQADAILEHTLIEKNSSVELIKWKYKSLYSRVIFKIPFLSRHGKWYMREIRRGLKTREKSILGEGSLYFGSAWFGLNQKALKVLCEREIKDINVFNFIKDLNRVEMVPTDADEIVYPTFFKSSRELKVLNTNLRFIDWENCSGFSPNVLKIRHLKPIMEADVLFARKFANESAELIAELDKIIL